MIKIDLDHVGLATHDLDRGRDVFTRFGFTCTAKSTHQGPVPPHGETGSWGSGNYCIMLQRGYFELIGVTDPSLPHPMVAERLEKYAGLHIIALGCQDGDAVAEELRGRMSGVEGRPMIYCFATCTDSIRTIPMLQHDKDKAEDLDTTAEDPPMSRGRELGRCNFVADEALMSTL